MNIASSYQHVRAQASIVCLLSLCPPCKSEEGTVKELVKLIEAAENDYQVLPDCMYVYDYVCVQTIGTENARHLGRAYSLLYV